MQDNNISFFFETSALNGDNIDTVRKQLLYKSKVEQAFNEATKFAFLQYIKDKVGKEPTGGVHLDAHNHQGSHGGQQGGQGKKGGCC